MARMRRPNSTASRSMARATMRLLSAPPAFFSAQRRALSTTSRYSGIWAAAVISEGLVVASRGFHCSIEWRAPVSATVTVMVLSCWRRFSAMAVLPPLYTLGREEAAGLVEEPLLLVLV